METPRYFSILLAISLAGCGGGGSDGDTSQNHQPVADAGADREIALNSQITLDGSASSDPDGDTLSYHWNLVSSPEDSTSTLSNANSVTPSISADKPGEYRLQLIVNDGELDSAPDILVLTAINSTPVAHAEIINPGTEAVGTDIQLDGSKSSDADNDPLRFSWTLTSVPDGSSASMEEADTSKAWFTPDAVGQYKIQLEVSDGYSSSTAELSVTIWNSAPIAKLNVGNGQATSSIGDTVSLLGTDSSDVDGDPLTYHFSITQQPVGSTAQITIPNSSEPSQAELLLDMEGEYTIQLIVNDGHTDSTPATVSVTAITRNIPPVANAGSDRPATVGKVFHLYGGNSGDPDGLYVSYTWSFVSKPDGSNATIRRPHGKKPDFTPDIAGDYEIELVVKDFAQFSEPDRVTIHAVVEGTQPVADAGNDRILSLGDSITLDGGASHDPDSSGTLSSQWAIDSAPAGSSASFDDDTSATPSITPDVAGEYVISLTVSDGSENSTADKMTLSVQPNIGQIDTGFGTDGMAFSDHDPTQLQTYYALSMVMDADGNSYLAGKQFVGDTATGSEYFTLWKFDSSGQLDTSFNSTGQVVDTSGISSVAGSITLDADGKLLAAGSYRPDAASYNTQLALWRYDTHGIADSSFGSNGRVLLTLPNSNLSDSALDVTTDSSGKIYVTGSRYDSDAGRTDMMLWKFNNDGTLDTLFNGVGFVRYESSFGSSSGRKLTLNSNDKIYVAGLSESENKRSDLALWSFNSDGSPNTGFNSTGRVIMNLSTETGYEVDSLYTLALDSQENIVVGGDTSGLSGDAVLLRFKPDGLLDSSFNNSGILILNTRAGRLSQYSQSDTFSDIVIDDDDNIYATGRAFGDGPGILFKFDSSGKQDTSFNHAGSFYKDSLNNFNNAEITGIAKGDNNKIYISGHSLYDLGNNGGVLHRDVFVIKIK